MWGLPGGTSGKQPTCQCRRCRRRRFNPWVGKIPWRRAQQPTLVFLPGESHGQNSLEGTVDQIDLACMKQGEASWTLKVSGKTYKHGLQKIRLNGGTLKTVMLKSEIRQQCTRLPLLINSVQKVLPGTSLVIQWLGIPCVMRGVRVPSLVGD